LRLVFAAKPHLPTVGGAQLTTHWLAREMGRRGHDVTVLAAQQRDGPPAPPVDWRWGYRTLHVDDPAAEIAALPERPDCVVVGGYGTRTDALTASLLDAAAGLPTVFYLHDQAAVPLVSRSFGGLTAAVSDFLAREVEAGGTPCPVLPPIVEADAYSVPTTREVALFVNPVPDKGVELAIDLARARPDIPFAFTRCWPLFPERLARVRRAEAELPNLEVRDVVHHPARLYGDARVLLVPSAYPEAFGRVVAEAQTSAIPVIARNVGGLPEAVGDGGILMPEAAGAPEWARALGELWDDRRAYARWSDRSSAQAARGQLTAPVVGDRFDALLAGLVPGTG
jgi:glycosyltransferase involved in cell wall biosynthesis